jgi:hypothetical protein
MIGKVKIVKICTDRSTMQWKLDSNHQGLNMQFASDLHRHLYALWTQRVSGNSFAGVLHVLATLRYSGHKNSVKKDHWWVRDQLFQRRIHLRRLRKSIKTSEQLCHKRWEPGTSRIYKTSYRLTSFFSATKTTSHNLYKAESFLRGWQLRSWSGKLRFMELVGS